MRNIKRIKLDAKSILLSTAILLSLGGCSKNSNVDETTAFDKSIPESTTYNSTEESKEKETNKNNETKEVETIIVEVPTTEAQKENTLTQYYNRYNEYFNAHGIDQQELFDMVCVLNDKITDDNGDLMYSVEDIWTAYSNISDLIEVPEVAQKIDNINAKEYGIDINDTIVINEMPKLSDMINTESKDSAFTIEKLVEFENFRDNLIKELNETGKYDKEKIREYVIKLTVTDINEGNGYTHRISSNSAEYVLSDINVSALQLAAMAYNQQEFLDVNVDGVKNLKINPTNGESDIENAVSQLLENGWINEATVAAAVSYYTYQVALNNEVDGEYIAERLGVTIDQANLLLAYVEYKSKMAITSYIQTKCNAEAKTVSEVQYMENVSNDKIIKLN